MSSVKPASIQPQKIELILAQLDNLPPLAPVATRILALTEDSRSNAKEIIELVASDPSLTTRILSLLSRAEHGLRREAITVEKAVLMLGFDTVRQVTLAAKVMEVFGSEDERGNVPGFDRMEFWKHCLGVACATRRIAMVTNISVRPEEAFVLGLLHDIGKDALRATMPKSFAKILRACRRTRADCSDAERALLGLDHTVVGHRLAERWGLPQPMVECIWLHHHAPEALPASVASGGHVQAVQLADTLVREHRIGFSGSDTVTVSSRELAERLGLPEAERIAIVESLADEIEARAAWIGALELTSSDVYLKALLRSTEDLSAANAALSEQNKRLERKADCFAALASLSHSVSPGASVREVCAACAEALRCALSISSILVFVTSEDGGWVEMGLSDGDLSSEILERPTDALDESQDAEAAVQTALAGTWIAPPGRAFDALIDRYRGRLGEGPTWLLPLVREQHWVGGAMFAADGGAVARLRSESVEFGALSAAVGLALAQAQAQAAAAALSDELAESNRRLATTQAELSRAKILKTVVAMAAGAAHELNNPLAVISARAQMLRDRTSDAEVRDALDTITKQAHAGSNIVTELMEFAEPRAPVPEDVQLGEFLNTLIAKPDLAASLGMVPAIEVPSDTPLVRFDREQLAQTFRELFRNAVDATDPASRRLTIKAAPDLTEENVVVVVTDNGRGMTAEVLNRAVDPFFSHRPAGRGHGLGLARVHRWLQENGGAIRIESDPGEGTSVTLRLPAAGSSVV